jgi:hypothetical protein
MISHPDDADVAKQGCLAIGLIGISGPDGLSAIRSPDNGCLECVKDAAAAHPTCEDIQQLAAAITLLTSA